MGAAGAPLLYGLEGAFGAGEFGVDFFVNGVVGFVFRDDLLHLADGGHVVKLLGDVYQFLDFAVHFVVVVFAHLGDADLLMEGGLGVFQLIEDFLVELFAFAETRVLDFHVLGVGEGDHALCKVCNPDRSTHVEDEYFAAVTLGAGLENQLAGLWDEHEETDDAFVGNRDGTAVLDLLLEQRDNGAVGTQDVAETRGDELSVLARLVPCLPALEGFHLELAVKALDVDFTDALGAAHYVGGIHSLVRRNHDELLDAVFDGHIGNDLGAVDVVHDGLGRIVLHHGDVLVCGRMEYVIRKEVPENEIHPGAAADAGDDNLARNVREVLRHHEANVVLGRFSLVDEHHLGRLELRHLPHYLHADGACRSGDEHFLAGEETFDGFHVHLDLGARQKVFHAYFPELQVLHFLVGEDTVTDTRFLGLVRHENLAACADENVLDLLVLAELICPERAHKDGLNAFSLHDIGNVILQGIDLHAHEAHVFDAVLVGDETLELEALGTLGADTLCYADTSCERAVYNAGNSLGIGIRGIEQELDEDTHSPHEKGGNEEGDNDLHEGKRAEHLHVLPLHEIHHADAECERHKISVHKLQKVDEARVAENARICPENSGPDPAQNRVEQRCEKNCRMMLICYLGVGVYPVSENT